MSTFRKIEADTAPEENKYHVEGKTIEARSDGSVEKYSLLSLNMKVEPRNMRSRINACSPYTPKMTKGTTIQFVQPLGDIEGTKP